MFLSDAGPPTLETLHITIRIGSTPAFLYFDVYIKHGVNEHNIKVAY